MYSGRVNVLAKVWDSIGGRQTGELRPGTSVTGDAPLGSGYVHLRSPVDGWTKKLWLYPYAEAPVTPPPPEPEPSFPPEVTLKIGDAEQVYVKKP